MGLLFTTANMTLMHVLLGLVLVSSALGDAVSVSDTGRNAYSHPLPNLSVQTRRAHSTGNSFFNENWVVAPASAASRDGLGPIFNARSCSACHPLDGRGKPESVSLLVRVSVMENGQAKPHPKYGDQLQPLAIPGSKAEAQVTLTWEDLQGLRRPRLRFENWRDGEPGAGFLTSPRVGNAVFGLGLLEAIPAEQIEARADPLDTDGDGISGRVNRVWGKDTKTLMLGRFGWKANQPTLRQQAADAFLGDIGITSSVNPVDDQAGDFPDGGQPELSDMLLQRVTVYLQTLAPPARRNVSDPQVVKGEQIFGQIQCAACHVAEWRTSESTALSELAQQTIHPYTDLLLHDLGDGLADGRPDQGASGHEWRTAPLWGMGLQKTVNGHTTLLHDGRARNAEEAILWHGGEAKRSREGYQALNEEERAALLSFLDSL